MSNVISVFSSAALGILAWTVPVLAQNASAQNAPAQNSLAQDSLAQTFPTQPFPTQPFPDQTPAQPLPQVLPQAPPNLPVQPDLPSSANPIEQSASTIFEDITLAPAFSPDPATIRGISGGNVSATDLTGRAETATGPCSGFIDQEPDHKLVLTQFFNFLSLQIQSNEDTTLVIRGPGGTWCNNDYSGQNPGIAGQWLSGTYEIWVGSPSTSAFHPYVIRMTEQKP